MNGKITADKKFEAEVDIVSYQVDERQLLRPSAFMDLAQEMAYRTSNAMHFGFDDLRHSSFVWVLTRMQIRFLRRPRWNERVRFATWVQTRRVCVLPARFPDGGRGRAAARGGHDIMDGH